MDNNVRINTYLRDTGYCSRRKADELIKEGRVEIESTTRRLATPGDKISPADKIYIDGKLLQGKETKVYIMLNKPEGIICTSNRHDGDNIIDFLGYEGYITYAGRLDKDSSGLILMTNDGALINAMMRSANEHEKEYICKVNKDITPEFVNKMEKGVPILDTVTKKCVVKKLGAREFSIILTQGLNRQIRRMCGELGYAVTYLKRVRVMSLKLGDLKIGEHRFLTREEIKKLKEKCLLEDYGKRYNKTHEGTH